MEINETPEQAAIRELKEETGLNGKISLLLGVTSTKSTLYNAILMAGYLVKTFNGNLAPGDDAVKAVFFDLSNLPEIAFDSHKQFIRISSTLKPHDAHFLVHL